MDRPTGPRLETLAPRVSGVFLALPVLFFRYPPMGDLAFHEAAVSLLRHYGDARYLPPDLYALNLGEPNQLFHFVAYGLSFLCSTDMACKLVVALTTVGLAVGASRLARHLDVSEWGAVIVTPLALGWMARWGLVANLTGLALLLGSLPLLDRAAHEPTPRRALGAVALTGLLFLAHESSMLEYAAAGLIFASRTPRRARPLALAMAPVVAAAGLAAMYAVRSRGLKAPSILAVDALPVPLLTRLTDFPASLFSVGSLSIWMLAGSVLGFGLVAYPMWRGTRERRFLVLGAALGVGYFVMPEAAFGSTLLHQRFLAPAFAIFGLASMPRASGSRFAPIVGLLPVAMLACTWSLFVVADRSYRDLDVVLAKMDDRAAVAQLDLTPRDPGVVAPVVGAAARALAVHGGRLLFSFTDAPTYPLTMRPDLQWNEAVSRLVRTPFAFAPAFDLTRFRYVLVWVPPARMRRLLARAFAPEAHLVITQGSFMLFQSNLPVDPVDSPDVRLPTPSPETLAARVRALLVERPTAPPQP